MTVPIPVPRLGPGDSAVHVVEWYQPDGASVHAGEPLCCVETGHVALDIEAAEDGVLEHRFPAGGTGAPGDLLAVIQTRPEQAGEASTGTKSPPVKRLKTPPPLPAAARQIPESLEHTRASGSPPIAFPLRHTAPDTSAFEWDAVPGDDADFESGLWPLPVHDETTAGDERTQTPGSSTLGAHPSPGRISPRDPAAPEAAAEVAEPGGAIPGLPVWEDDEKPAEARQARAMPAASSAASAGMAQALVLRTTATLTEATKMRDQLTREWRADGLAVSYDDIVVRAVARAWGEATGVEPSIGLRRIAVADSHSVLISGAARRPFREAVAQRAAPNAGAAAPDALVTSLLGSGVEDAAPRIEPATVMITIGDQREAVSFDGEAPRPIPVVSLSLACAADVMPDDLAVSLLGRIRELVESPYALLVD